MVVSMLKVNSKRTIHLLAKSSFKASRMRNLFAIVAIILTSVMFSGLFTVATSLVASIEESTMRQVGGSAHGSFKYLSKAQYDALKTHPDIKDISFSVVLGVGENKELAKHPTEIRYTSGENNAKGMFSMPTTGKLPQNDDEIATDTLVLKQLGVSAKLGQKVTLDYSLAGEKISKTFTLVGYWTGDKVMQASQAWVSKSYVEKQLANYKPSKQGYDVGLINADVNFKNSFRIESKLQKVIVDSGFSLDDIDYGVNWAYTGNGESLDISTIVATVGAILMIAFSGYLMIANVFTISVANDVRYYGLIKTIGTTPKQIRKLIRRQAMWLCFIGLPIGLLVGYLVGMMLVPIVLSIMNTDVIKISAHPLIFILSSIFSAVTVFVSVSKPSKIAAKVSPIEALRVTDNSAGSKRKIKKGTKVNLWTMAYSNLARNKKKVVLVSISLSLGLVILNATYSIANSFDMDEYLSRSIMNDFAVGDVSNFNVNLNYSNQDTLSEGFFSELSLQEGIESINNIYFTEYEVPTGPRFVDIPKQLAKEYDADSKRVEALKRYAQEPKQLLHLYGLDEGALQKLILLHGKIEEQKLYSGKYVIAAPFDAQGNILYYAIGDKIQLPDPTGQMREYEVLAVADIPESISARHSHPLTPTFYLPSQVFLEQIEQKAPMLSTIDVQDSAMEKMERFLANYSTNTDQNMEFESKASLAAEFENLQKTLKIVGITISILVAFIGIMNFINSVITSINARRRELAMLQSIGMLNRQVIKMLILESTMYILLTIAATLTIGSAICYLGLNAFTAGAAYMKLYFTVVPSLLCLPILLVIAIIVPVMCQKVISKSSIVERLRKIE